MVFKSASIKDSQISKEYKAISKKVDELLERISKGDQFTLTLLAKHIDEISKAVDGTKNQLVEQGYLTTTSSQQTQLEKLVDLIVEKVTG